MRDVQQQHGKPGLWTQLLQGAVHAERTAPDGAPSVADSLDNAVRPKRSKGNGTGRNRAMEGARNHTGHRVGEWHQHAKLTDAQVREIRHKREEMGMGYGEIAALMQTSAWTIRDICTYRSRASA